MTIHSPIYSSQNVNLCDSRKKLSASVAQGALIIAMLAAMPSARAADECGFVAASITCTAPQAANGVAYQSVMILHDVTLDLSTPFAIAPAPGILGIDIIHAAQATGLSPGAMNLITTGGTLGISTTGNGAAGMRIYGYDALNVDLSNAALAVATTGGEAHGIALLGNYYSNFSSLQSVTGDVHLGAGTILTEGDGSHGVYYRPGIINYDTALPGSLSDAAAIQTHNLTVDTNIETRGNNSYGILMGAITRDAAAQTTINVHGDIATRGTGSSAVGFSGAHFAQGISGATVPLIAQPPSTVTINIDANLTTSGNYSRGVDAGGSGGILNYARIDVSQLAGSDIHTGGQFSDGVYVGHIVSDPLNPAFETGVINIAQAAGASIVTDNLASRGIAVSSTGGLGINVAVAGDISTRGTFWSSNSGSMIGAHGIEVRAETGLDSNQNPNVLLAPPATHISQASTSMISTLGERSSGIYAVVNGGAGGASGALAFIASTQLVDQAAGARITTSGDMASGISLLAGAVRQQCSYLQSGSVVMIIADPANAPAGASCSGVNLATGGIASQIVNTGGLVQTTGDGSNGVDLTTYGYGLQRVQQAASGVINATGADADGISISALAARPAGINPGGTIALLPAGTAPNATGPISVDLSGRVSGGWGGGAGVAIDGVAEASQAVIIDIRDGGSLTALSDRAIMTQDVATNAAIKVGNAGTISGFVDFAPAATGSGVVEFTNSGLFDVRRFADTDGDGMRDTKGVSVSRFGGEAGTFFDNTGTVRLAGVSNPTSISQAGTYLPQGDDSSAHSLFNGASQGQMLGLPLFINSGVIDLSNGYAGDILVLSGSDSIGTPGNGIFRSNGGTLLIDAYLNGGGSASRSDVLAVDTTQTGAAGATTIVLTSVGGAGQLSDTNGNRVWDEGEGILVVDVRNAAGSDSRAFRSGGAIVGAYSYGLQYGAAGGDWYFSNVFDDQGEPVLAPTVPTYEGYVQAMGYLNELPTLQQRVGNRYWSGFGNGQIEQGDGDGSSIAGDRGAVDTRAVWTRFDLARDHIGAEASSAAAQIDANRWVMRSGVEGMLAENENSTLIGGLTLHYGQGSTDIASPTGAGAIKTTGMGIGSTLTWYLENGFYLDGQAHATWLSSDLFSATHGKLAEGNDGFGYSLSLEAGKRFDLNHGWTMTPQAQLTYSRVSFDAFTDPFGSAVSGLNGKSLVGRLGVTLDHESVWEDDKGDKKRNHLYGIANLHYEFEKNTALIVSGTQIVTAPDRLTGELGIGGSHNWNNDKYSIFGEASVSTSLSNFGKDYGLKGKAGFHIKF